MEQTFQHGFSHDSTGDRLKGKIIVLSFTTGAPSEMYAHDGAMCYTIEEFVLPSFKAICNLCQMKFAGYVYTGGISYINRMSQELLVGQKAKSVKHAERLIELIDTL